MGFPASPNLILPRGERSPVAAARDTAVPTTTSPEDRLSEVGLWHQTKQPPDCPAGCRTAWEGAIPHARGPSAAASSTPKVLFLNGQCER